MCAYTHTQTHTHKHTLRERERGEDLRALGQKKEFLEQRPVFKADLRELT